MIFPAVNYVPCVPFNLVSVCCLTKTLNCSIIYFSSCTFHDLRTKKMTGGDMNEMACIIFSMVINLK